MTHGPKSVKLSKKYFVLQDETCFMQFALWHILLYAGENLHKLQYTLALVKNEISSLLKMFCVTKELGNALNIIKLKKGRYKRA